MRKAWAKAVLSSSSMPRTYTRAGVRTGECRNTLTTDVASGNRIPASAARVHTNGLPGRLVHAAANSAIRAGAIRLRRRLSKIFHLLISGSGFLAKPWRVG